MFQHGALSNFYEIQARSWLHGHWDADAGAYLFERFKVDGRYYTYFGPWPALLRLVDFPLGSSGSTLISV